jgi:hypothetical protein
VRYVPLALGGLALILGVCARLAGSPDEVTWHGRTYAIVSRERGEAQCFDFVRDDQVAFSECGSLDLFCDPPTAARFDVDGDGTDDVYFETCSGPRYVTEKGGEIVEQRVPEAPRLGWWARQVEGGGVELLVVGLLLVAAGVAPTMRY